MAPTKDWRVFYNSRKSVRIRFFFAGLLATLNLVVGPVLYFTGELGAFSLWMLSSWAAIGLIFTLWGLETMVDRVYAEEAQREKKTNRRRRQRTLGLP